MILFLNSLFLMPETHPISLLISLPWKQIDRFEKLPNQEEFYSLTFMYCLGVTLGVLLDIPFTDSRVEMNVIFQSLS